MFDFTLERHISSEHTHDCQQGSQRSLAILSLLYFDSSSYYFTGQKFVWNSALIRQVIFLLKFVITES